MSRWKIALLLLVCIATVQMLTALGRWWLPVYLHALDTPFRPLLMIGMTSGLLMLLLKCAPNLTRSECLALVIGTAGGLANLIDILRLGAAVDFIPVAPDTLASPGDFLIAAGFLGFLPLSLRHARRGRGLYRLYRGWRDEIRMRVLGHIPP